MYQQYNKHSWSQIVIGAAMLLGLALVVSIKLASTIGLGRAVASILGGILIAVWLVVGVVLIVRGLNRM